jgi:hypothetical protein
MTRFPLLLRAQGFGSGAGMWLANMADLASSFTVYAVDLPGGGLTVVPEFSVSGGSEMKVEGGRMCMGVENGDVRDLLLAEAHFVDRLEVCAHSHQQMPCEIVTMDVIFARAIACHSLLCRCQHSFIAQHLPSHCSDRFPPLFYADASIHSSPSTCHLIAATVSLLHLHPTSPNP